MTWSAVSINLHRGPHDVQFAVLVVCAIYTINCSMQVFPNIRISYTWMNRANWPFCNVSCLEYLPYSHICTILSNIQNFSFVQMCQVKCHMGVKLSEC